MRIISGTLKGRRLNSFKASHLRPTTDRVKEVIFNKLMGVVQGARVLDLFSGTGNLSFEAYSRGASEIIAVEKSPKSLKILEGNREALKVSNGFKVIAMDVFQFIKKSQEPAFDLLLVDPPFTQKLAHQVMEELQHSSLHKQGSWVVIESTKHEKIAESYGLLNLIDRKDYGDKFLSFFRHESIEESV